MIRVFDSNIEDTGLGLYFLLILQIVKPKISRSIKLDRLIIKFSDNEFGIVPDSLLFFENS